MDWHRVDVELQENDLVTQIKVNGKKLCLVKNKGEIHILQNTCPHAGGILSGGWCDKGNLVCPIHRYEYDLNTGKGAAGQGDYIDVYPTEFREDGLYVGMKRSFLKRLFSK